MIRGIPWSASMPAGGLAAFPIFFRQPSGSLPFAGLPYIILFRLYTEVTEPMEKYCDLHVHSIYSDGTSTPSWLILEGERLGLEAVALCDHNTVSGLPEFREAALGRPIEAVCGCEFSTDYAGDELHILGLFLQPRDFPAIEAFLQEGLERKEQSNIDLIDALKKAGYRLDYAAIKAATPNGQVNRAHVAAALAAEGYVQSVDEAFHKLLLEKHGFYHPCPHPDSLKTIFFLKSIGATAVLAHPLLSLKEEKLRRFLTAAVPAGLDAMETRYVTYDTSTTLLAEAIAGEFGLLPSGGSDFHGDNKPGIRMGTGKGSLRVPAEYLPRLRPY